MNPRSLTRLLVGLAAVALLATGCAASTGSGSAKDPVATPHLDKNLHRDLPADVLQRGRLRVVTDASYAPASSFAPDGRTIIGFEPDLGAALGKVLGIDVVFRNADFTTLPGLVETGKADMIMSAMTDTAEREKQLDFVDYFSAGTSIVVQRGNPKAVTDLLGLCGQKVAVQAGTTQQDLLKRQQGTCTRPITVLSAATNDDALVLLRTGRAAAMLMDYPPAEVLTTDPRTRAHYQLASTAQLEPGLYGIGFAKGQDALRQTVQAALAELLADGVYTAILSKWAVSQGAVSSVSTNAATTS
jgi:polar amino acid transport system substrate-binding protein